MPEYQYSAYGLIICSALPIPELLPVTFAVSSPDVWIRYGKLEPPRAEELGTFYFARADEAGLFYFLRDIGSVLVRDGREIVVDPLPGSEAKGFRHLVSGIAMGLLLHQRRVLTLHASAVAVGGAAVAFLGWKGMGKSTTASALHARGHAVITDDLLVLDVENDPVTVVPGFPSLKLWPEAVAAAFGENPEPLSKIHPDSTKRSRPVTEGFSQAALPLRRIYVLDYNAVEKPTEVRSMSARDAYIELVRHSFAVRLLKEDGVTSCHFQQCYRLVRLVSICRLERKHGLDNLASLACQIEEDLDIYNSNDEASLENAHL